MQYCNFSQTTDKTGYHHGRLQKLFQGSQLQHFAYLFQIADDAMQMDLHNNALSFLHHK